MIYVMASRRNRKMHQKKDLLPWLVYNVKLKKRHGSKDDKYDTRTTRTITEMSHV